MRTIIFYAGCVAIGIFTALMGYGVIENGILQMKTLLLLCGLTFLWYVIVNIIMAK